MSAGEPQEREVVDQSRYYVLAMTAEGWGVWDRTLSPDDPVAFFPSGDDAYDLAAEYYSRANRAARFRRWTWLDVLRWVAIATGVTWAITSAIVTIAFDGGFTEDPFASTRWAQIVAGVAQPIFFVAVGLSVIVWLRDREA